MYSSENSGVTTPKANMCPVLPSNDLGELRVMVTQVFQKVPTTPLFYSYELLVSLKPIFLSSQKLTVSKKEKKRTKKKEAINKNGPWH